MYCTVLYLWFQEATLKLLSSDQFIRIRNKENLGFWAEELYHRICFYSHDSMTSCDLTPSVDLHLLIDTSGKQVNRLGDKKKILMKFVKNLYAKFSDKSKVDFKVTVFGDYEAGEASDLVELEDGEKLSDDLLKDKLDAFQWYIIYF